MPRKRIAEGGGGAESEHAKLAKRAVKHISSTAVNGYSHEFSESLTRGPDPSGAAVMRDKSLFLPLPRDFSATLMERERPLDDSVFLDDPGKVRAVLVFTVPARLLEPNATAFIHFNTRLPLAADCSRALSFFLHALYTAAYADNNELRVFLEAVVIDSSYVNAAGGSTEFLCDRANISGIRVWALLSTKCFGPEALMRRALFRTQHVVKLCKDAELDMRLRYLIRPDPAYRLEKIRGDTPLPPELRADPAAAARGDDEAGVMQDPDGEAAAKRQREITELQTAFVNRVVKMIAPPLTGTRAADAHDKMPSHNPGKAFITINTLTKYVRQFCMPLLAQIDPRPLPEALKTKLLNNLESEWGDALRFDMPASLMNAPHALTASEADMVRGQLSVAARLSLDASNVTLVYGLPDDKRYPCDEQITPASYFRPDGQFGFPFAALVHEVLPRRAAPETLMRYEWPWVYSRFRTEMNVLKAELAQQRRLSIATAVRAAPQSSMHRPILPEKEQAYSRDRFTNASDGRSTLKRVLRAAGLCRDEEDDDGDDCSVYLQEMNRALSDYNAGTTLLDRLDEALSARTDTVDTHVVVSDLTRLAAKVQKDWLEAVDVIDSLAAPEGSDPAMWHETVRRRMRWIYNTEMQETVLATLNSGGLVSEQHTEAYQLMLSADSPSDFCKPIRSTDDELTISASAIVHRVLLAAVLEFPGIVPLLEMILINAPQSAAIGKATDNPTHSVHVGAPGTGKSLMAELAEQACLQSSVQKMTYASKKALLNGQFMSSRLIVGDEGGAAITNPAEMARTNPEDVAQFKQMLSSTTHTFSRMEHDDVGRHVLVQARVERNFIWTWMVNAQSFGHLTARPPDTAVVDRTDSNLFAYRASAMHQAPIEAALNPRRSEVNTVWEGTCVRSRELMAHTIFLLLLSCTNIYPVNTSAVDTMEIAGLMAVKPYLPDALTKVRMALRARSYGTLLCFSTVTHELLTDYGSVLLSAASAPGMAPVPCPVQLPEFARLAAPMLYTRVDHGLWTVFRQLHCYYPFVYYAIIRTIAARECHFRRRLMRIAYRLGKVETIEDEVARVWQQRGLTDSVLCLPAFVHDLLTMEAELDFEVERRNGMSVMPKFSSYSANSSSLSRYADDDGDGGGDGRHRRGGDPLAADNSPQTRDPNWLNTGLTANDLSQQAQVYLRAFHLKSEQIKTVLDALAGNVIVEVPTFTHVSSAFGGGPPGLEAIKFQYAAQSLYSNVPELVRQPQPIVKLMRSPNSDRATVHINTAALMVPPQYLACLALTAFETPHTRLRRTVLMAQSDRDYRALYGWTVRPRDTTGSAAAAGASLAATGTLASTAHRRAYVYMQQSSSVAGTDRSGVGTAEYVHRVRQASSQTGTGAGAGGASARDIEDFAFDKHIREANLAPEVPTMLKSFGCSGDVTHARLVDQMLERYTNEEGVFDHMVMTAADADAVLKAWIEAHSARPGAAEERRRAREARERRLTFKVEYPSAHMCETAVERTLTELLRKQPAPLVLSLADQDALDAARSEKIRELRARIAARKQRMSALDSDEAERAAVTEVRALSDQIGALEEERQRDVWPEAERRSAMPPHLQEDTADAEASAKQDHAVTAFCQELCAPALFNRHTRVLSDCEQWRNLFALVFERATGSRTLPAGPIVPSAEQKQYMLDHLKDVPGYLLDGVYTLTIAVLQWLERALDFERQLARIYNVYCGSECGKYADFYEAYLGSDSDDYVGECAAAFRSSLARHDPATQTLGRRAWALVRRIRAQWFRVESDVYSKKAQMEHGRIPAKEADYARLAEQAGEMMERHNFAPVASGQRRALAMMTTAH